MNPTDPGTVQPEVPPPAEAPDDFKPMLIGAAVIFVIAFIPYAGLMCCLPQILGAMLAVHVFTKEYKLTLTYGEGIRLGILTTLLGGVTAWVVAIALLFTVHYQVGGELVDMMVQFFGKFMPPDAVEKMKEGIAQQKESGPTVAQLIIGFIGSLVTAGITGLIGGSLGTAIFKRGPKEPGAF
jgi:hypothetical protein